MGNGLVSVRAWIRPHTFTFSGRKTLADALAFAGVLFPSNVEFRYLSGKKNLREAGKLLLRKGATIVERFMSREQR